MPRVTSYLNAVILETVVEVAMFKAASLGLSVDTQQAKLSLLDAMYDYVDSLGKVNDLRSLSKPKLKSDISAFAIHDEASIEASGSPQDNTDIHIHLAQESTVEINQTGAYRNITIKPEEGVK